MVRDFHIGDKHNASFYAGILISSFSLSEALTGMLWGSLSDRVGRKPVLLLGCLGTMLSLLVVGFSTNFAMALVGRALGGFLNGNIGVIQTMVDISSYIFQCDDYLLSLCRWESWLQDLNMSVSCHKSEKGLNQS